MNTILIVEDVELNIDLLEQILEEDYQLVLARDGAEAVAQAVKHEPDLILMDLSLPVVDGFSATRQIKQISSLANTPIIALTAHAMRGDREKALECGCQDYLSKPLDEDALLSKISALMAVS